MSIIKNRRLINRSIWVTVCAVVLVILFATITTSCQQVTTTNSKVADPAIETSSEIADPAIEPSPEITDPAVEDPPTVANITAYGTIEPSGCGHFEGKVKIRFDLFMTPDAPYYNLYPVGNSFHSHMVHFETKVSDKELLVKLVEITEYFYAFYLHCWENDKEFIEEWQKVPVEEGTVREPFVPGSESEIDCNAKADDIKARHSDFDTRQLEKVDKPPPYLNIGGS